jgi:hypothetical protein
MSGSFPPFSSRVFAPVWAAALAIARPVVVEPTWAIRSIPG